MPEFEGLSDQGICHPTDGTHELAWLDRWAADGLSSEVAQNRFEHLPAVAVEEMTGLWRGSELPTGHPVDGLLGLYLWRGKRFVTPDFVDPLLFDRGQDILALNPAVLPVGLALALPRLVRTGAAQALFDIMLPMVATRAPKARLRGVERGGVVSAAMIYDAKPIIDHFRRVDEDRMLGLMELRSTRAPYFFLLTRE